MQPSDPWGLHSEPMLIDAATPRGGGIRDVPSEKWNISGLITFKPGQRENMKVGSQSRTTGAEGHAVGTDCRGAQKALRQS